MTAVARKDAIIALGDWARQIVLVQFGEAKDKHGKTPSTDDVSKVRVPAWFYDAWAALAPRLSEMVVLLGMELEKIDTDEIIVVFNKDWWVTHGHA